MTEIIPYSEGMDLVQFAEMQVLVVERFARQCFSLSRFPNHDLEGTIQRVLGGENPYLKAISQQEIIDEVFDPGSFRRAQLTRC